jgi:D-galactarolactone cycloisomerase
MKITDVKSYVLQYEMDQELGFSQTYFKTRTAHIVEVFTDEGINGIGEVFGVGNVALGNSAIIERVIKPLIVGENPLGTEVIWHKVYNTLREYGQKGMLIQCLSGIDIALWDIAGKVYKKPLYLLLGGQFRKKIKVYGYGMLFKKIEDLKKSFKEEAINLKETGFRAIKMKIGKSLDEDIILVQAVREAVGSEIKLMVDANHAYTSTVAIPLGRELERLNVYWFEEPVAPEDHEGYLEVKHALDIPIAGGECEFTRWGFRDFIAKRCVDFLQPEVCACGGITEFRKIVALASAWGIPVIPHVWGSAIAIVVNLHLITSLCDFPGAYNPVEPMLEYDTTPNIFREELLTEPLRIIEDVRKSGGYTEVVDKWGIGVELNRNLIRRFRVN